MLLETLLPINNVEVGQGESCCFLPGTAALSPLLLGPEIKS